MKIRSITLGTAVDDGLETTIERAGRLLSLISDRFSGAGYELQTTRVSLPPLVRLAGQESDLATLAERVEVAIVTAGIGYVALGPLRWTEDPPLARQLARGLPVALSGRNRVFASVETADANGVQFEAVKAAAGVIRVLADSTEQGFGNLRFAALANCPPDIPFFPAAYHEAREPVFGLALQAADLAVGAFQQADTLDHAERRLTAVVEAELSRLEEVASSLERDLELRYAGADPTPAPFPDDRESIGAALESLGVGRFGVAGTLAAAALVTRSLRKVRARSCGFAGVMLPVMEDSVLARSAAEGLYSWEELLLYSSVCGTGLDTVPLPGDITADELEAMILDVSSMAVALGKPLTCRLFPVPGKAAGEMTSFDFPFFVNAGVLRPKGMGSPMLIRRGLGPEPASSG
jgi:uncharacterized protein (UPF0210 family)